MANPVEINRLKPQYFLRITSKKKNFMVHYILMSFWTVIYIWKYFTIKNKIEKWDFFF